MTAVVVANSGPAHNNRLHRIAGKPGLPVSRGVRFTNSPQMEPQLVEQPAHKILIDRYLDWERVRERLNRYEHMRQQYPIRFLQDCLDRSPFYCHYLAWRLGTWMSEELFKFLDDLFATGASLKNRDSNRNLLKSCSFDDFWGLVWQLQIAKLFCGQEGVQVEWMNSGPDLKLNLRDKAFFVECYTYRKSFGIEAFIEEIYNHIT